MNTVPKSFTNFDFSLKFKVILCAWYGKKEDLVKTKLNEPESDSRVLAHLEKLR